MTTIKNIEKQGTELNSDDLFKELRQFYNVFEFKESFGSADQRIEYGIAYFNSVISYYSLILQCDDISEADKKNYEKDLKSAEESLKGLKEEQETLRKQEEQEEQEKNSPRLAQLHIKTPFLFIKS